MYSAVCPHACVLQPHLFFFFFFNDTATTEIYTLSLHDALPIWSASSPRSSASTRSLRATRWRRGACSRRTRRDRKSTRLNSSHQIISYAVFCLKKKKKKHSRVASHSAPTYQSPQLNATHHTRPL